MASRCKRRRYVKYYWLISWFSYFLINFYLVFIARQLC